MGAIYLTRMTGLGKQVALKVFASLGDSNLRRRFERETALMLEISYPGDGAFWRRMYCGLLLICDATPEARQTLGVKLPGSEQCLSLSPWQGSATLKLWSLTFDGASAVVCRRRLLRLERVF